MIKESHSGHEPRELWCRKATKGAKGRAVFDPAFLTAAETVGRALARDDIELIYGGGNVGLMGILADAALAAGGRVTGVIPQFLLAKELGHRGVTDLRIVATMHERKALMADLSDGFLALPGGFGTLDEFCEILTWGQLGLHTKPCGLLNVAGFYDPFLAQIDRAVHDRLVRSEHRNLILVDDAVDNLLARMRHQRPVETPKWMDREVR
jgi:uncharacterized protein (TIGR00730 family)